MGVTIHTAIIDMYPHASLQKVITLADHEHVAADYDRKLNNLWEVHGLALIKIHNLEKQHNDLMAQAVRFAELLVAATTLLDCNVDETYKGSAFKDPGFKAAQAFLSSPEVQAFKAQQKEGG